MNVGKPVGKMKSTESDVCYFEVDAVFHLEPVEMLEESTWTAGLRKTGNDTGQFTLDFANSVSSRRLGYCGCDEPTLSELYSEADDRMFNGVVINPEHVLHQFLTEREQTYNLRRRPHGS